MNQILTGIFGPTLTLLLVALGGAAAEGCDGGPQEAPPGAGGGAGQAGAGGAGGAGGGVTTGSGGAGGAVGSPHFKDLVPEKVNVIKPGGDTICARGTEYAYFVIPGDPDKVILEFEGGGACWDDITCSFAKSIFKDHVDVTDFPSDPSTAPGWYNRANPGHPMKGWTHVYVPYCTGDVHWGDNVKTYGSGTSAITIRHKGSVNVKAVLGWIYAELESPKKIFVTGCSAGGYGSIWWAPEVQHHYPGAQVYHFADSAAGVITADFFQKSFPSWNVQASFPSFLGDFKAASTLPLLYDIIAAYYPKNVYSQYNTVLDENQTFYYVAMGGKDANEWSAKMKESVKEIESASPNFRAFLPDGTQHCILPFDDFYTVDAGGVKLTDWLSDMVNDKPIQNASCPGCAP